MDTELYGRRKLFFVQSYSQAFLIFLFFSDGNNYMNLRNGSQCQEALYMNYTFIISNVLQTL